MMGVPLLLMARGLIFRTPPVLLSSCTGAMMILLPAVMAPLVARIVVLVPMVVSVGGVKLALAEAMPLIARSWTRAKVLAFDGLVTVTSYLAVASAPASLPIRNCVS